MLRRLLLVIVAAGALMLSAGIGFLAADWPFLHRLWRLPADRAEWRVTVRAPVEAFDGGGSAFFPVATPGERTIESSALAQAESWAQAHDSVALLVLHRGRLQLERYWQGLSRDALYPVQGLSRSLLGVVYGCAISDGLVRSLDASVDHWLTEWRGERRGAITLRQLLQNVSGLETPALDSWVSLLGKGGRLQFGTESVRAALSFDLAHEPGTHFAVSPVDAQLLGIVLERASAERFPEVISQMLWRPIGAGVAGYGLDRRGGMAAVFDGLRAAPVDLLRVGALLVKDGVADGQQVLPQGWVREMARGSVPNPHYGLEAWQLEGGGLMMAGDGHAIWVWPDEQLVIVRLGRATPGWDAGTLPAILRGGLADRVTFAR